MPVKVPRDGRGERTWPSEVEGEVPKALLVRRPPTSSTTVGPCP